MPFISANVHIVGVESCRIVCTAQWGVIILALPMHDQDNAWSSRVIHPCLLVTLAWKILALSVSCHFNNKLQRIILWSTQSYIKDSDLYCTCVNSKWSPPSVWVVRQPNFSGRCKENKKSFRISISSVESVGRPQYGLSLCMILVCTHLLRIDHYQMMK